MAGNLGRYSDQVWDRFFDFIFCPEEQLTRDEVKAELQRYRIDVSPAIARVKAALEARDAREGLERARAQRPSILAKLGQVAAPIRNVRESLQEIISQLSGSQQAAYYHKLERAASDEDLQSLLEDLYRLDCVSEDDNGGKKGE